MDLDLGHEVAVSLSGRRVVRLLSIEQPAYLVFGMSGIADPASASLCVSCLLPDVDVTLGRRRRRGDLVEHVVVLAIVILVPYHVLRYGRAKRAKERLRGLPHRPLADLTQRRSFPTADRFVGWPVSWVRVNREWNMTLIHFPLFVFNSMVA